MVLEIKEKLYIGDLSPLSTLLQKSSNWSMVYNLRNPLKTSFPGWDQASVQKKDEGSSLKIIRVKIFSMFQ
jgi:hypothetical protein